MCEVSAVSPFLMLLPITTIISGVLILDEQVTLYMAIGGLMVLVGVFSTLIDWRRKKLR